MQEFFNCLFSTNGMAYGTGVLVFFITLFLVTRRLIGFTLTLLFLIFAIVAALGVANKDLIRDYFENLSKPNSSSSTSSTYQSASASKTSEASIYEQLQKAYDDLKLEFEIQKKKKFQSFLEEQRASHEKTEETVKKSSEEKPNR